MTSRMMEEKRNCYITKKPPQATYGIPTIRVQTKNMKCSLHFYHLNSKIFDHSRPEIELISNGRMNER